MLFMVQCIDKPNSLELRMATRPSHIDYLQKHLAHIVISGALLADDGQTMIGSGYVLDYPDRAAIDAFYADDPYVRAGLYERIEIRPYRKVHP